MTRTAANIRNTCGLLGVAFDLGPQLLSIGCLGFALFVHAKAKRLVNSSAPIPIKASLRSVSSVASQTANRVISASTTPVQAPLPEGLTITPNPAGLRIDGPDDVSLQIGRHQSGNQMGFMLTFINDQLGAIGRIGMLIDNAQSFNERRNAYRERAVFNSARLTYTDTVLPSCSSRPRWLVRKEPSSPHLLAGDSDQSPMIWPENDNSTIQRWRIALSGYMQTVPVRTVDVPVQLRAIDFNIVVAWHREENEFFVEPA